MGTQTSTKYFWKIQCIYIQKYLKLLLTHCVMVFLRTDMSLTDKSQIVKLTMHLLHHQCKCWGWAWMLRFFFHLLAVSASGVSGVADFEKMLEIMALEEEDCVLSWGQSVLWLKVFYVCCYQSVLFIIWHFFTFNVLILELVISVYPFYILYIHFIHFCFFQTDQNAVLYLKNVIFNLV